MRSPYDSPVERKFPHSPLDFVAGGLFTPSMFMRGHSTSARVLWLVWLFWCASPQPGFAESKKLYEKLGPEFRFHSEEVQSLHEKAEGCFFEGDYARGRELLKEASQVIARTPNADPRDLPNLLTSVAEFDLELGEFDQAAAVLKQAIDAAEKSLGPDHPILARALNVSGAIARAEGRLDDAISSTRRSEAIWTKAHDEKHYGALQSAHNLAVIYRDQGKYSESLAIL